MHPAARSRCADVRVGDSVFLRFPGGQAKALVLDKVRIEMMRKDLSAPRASACGIPASRPLFVLDPGKAYS